MAESTEVPTRRSIYLSRDEIKQIIGWGTMAQVHGSPPRGDLAGRLMALRNELAELPEMELATDDDGWFENR